MQGLRMTSAALHIADSAVGGAGAGRSSGGGGFYCGGGLDLVNSSLHIHDATAQPQGFGGAFFLSMLYPNGPPLARLARSNVTIQNCRAGLRAGGFAMLDSTELLVVDSKVRISNVSAPEGSGGFEAGYLRLLGSELQVQHARTEKLGGGFLAWNFLANNSRLTLSYTSAASAGGFSAQHSFQLIGSSLDIVRADAFGGGCAGFEALCPIEIKESTVRVSSGEATGGGGGFCAGAVWVSGSHLSISDSVAMGHAGGMQARGPLHLQNSSLDIRRCRSGKDGGGVWVGGDMLVGGGSLVSVWDAESSGLGGGLMVSKSLKVKDRSEIHMDNVSAGQGGGIHAYKNISAGGGSSLAISGGTAQSGHGGGFVAEGALLVASSSVSIDGTEAAATGGGFYVGSARISDGSVLVVADSTASETGGGFRIGGSRVAGSLEVWESNLTVAGSAAGDGGGFHAGNVSLRHAQVNVQGRAGGRGGGFLTRGLVVQESELTVAGEAGEGEGGEGGGFVSEGTELRASRVLVEGTARRGGGFRCGSLMLQATVLEVQRAAARSGSAGYAGAVRAENSRLRLQGLQGLEGLPGGSALAADCFELTHSTLLCEAATETGLFLQNSMCSSACGQTFSIDAESGINASGVVSALLSIDTCENESVQLAGIDFRTQHAAVAEVPSSEVFLENVTVEYTRPIQDSAVILATPSFHAESVAVACPGCARGVTFSADQDGLHAVSRGPLSCAPRATLASGSTARCGCDDHQVPDEGFGELVGLEQTLSYCTFCPRQSEYEGGGCRKCPVYKASVGVGRGAWLVAR